MNRNFLGTKPEIFTSTFHPLFGEALGLDILFTADHRSRFSFVLSIACQRAKKKADVLVSVQLIIYLERLRRKTFLRNISLIFAHSLALKHNNIKYFAIYH